MGLNVNESFQKTCMTHVVSGAVLIKVAITFMPNVYEASASHVLMTNHEVIYVAKYGF